MVSNPSKVPAVIVLEPQIVSMMGALNVREGINSGVAASTARRVPLVGTKIAHTKAPMAPRNQAMHSTTLVCRTDH
jgi:hypothetical protein